MGFWVKVVCFFSGYWTIGIVINDKLYQKLPEFSSSPDMLLSIEITLFTSWTDANTGNEQDIFNSTFFSASLYFLCVHVGHFFFLFISADRPRLTAFRPLSPQSTQTSENSSHTISVTKKRLDRAFHDLVFVLERNVGSVWTRKRKTSRCCTLSTSIPHWSYFVLCVVDWTNSIFSQWNFVVRAPLLGQV